MGFDDHPPPHFHVITRSDERAVYLIETLALWAGVWVRWQEYSEEES